MAIESLTIDLNARLAKFESELRKVGTSVERHAKATQTAYQKTFDGLEAGARRLAATLGAGFAIGGLVSFTRDAIASIAALDDLSERTGLTVELLDQLQQVAQIGGHSLEDVATTASKFARSVALAAGGNKELLQTFSELGITQQQLKSQAFDETYLQFARAIATAENQVNAIARAQTLAGKAAAQAIPFFRDLAEEGLRGARVTTEQAAAAEQFEKSAKRLAVTVDGLKIALGNDLVKQLNAVAAAMKEAAKDGGILGAVWAGLVESLSQSFGSKAANDLGRLNVAIDASEKKIAGLRRQAQEQPFRAPVLEGFASQEQARLDALVKERQRLQSIVDIETGKAFQNVPPQAQPTLRPEPTGVGDGAAASAAKARLDALSSLAESRAKRTVETEARFAALRLKTLDGFYAEGLVAEQEYWSTREAIQREGLAKELAAADAEIAAIRKQRPSETGTADQVKAQRELEDALARRNKLEQEFGAFVVENGLQASKAAREYADAVADLDARMAELEGRSADALAIRQAQQSRALRASLTANRDDAGLARLEAFERAGRAQAELNDLRVRGQDITERLAIGEERIQNSRRTGAISEIESLRRTSAERQRSVEQLREVADAVDRVAASSGNERLRLQAEQFRAELERLESQADLLKDKFDQIGETSLAQFFEDVITGTKSVSDAFKDMADNIAREISRLAAQDIAKRILGGLGDSGFDFGSILAKLFGGGRGGSSPLNLSSFGPAFADGGSFIVGGGGGIDRTPVFFRATQGERVTVTPPGKSASVGGVNVVNHFTINGPADARTQMQISSAAGRGIAHALRRNG